MLPAMSVMSTSSARSYWLKRSCVARRLRRPSLQKPAIRTMMTRTRWWRYRRCIRRRASTAACSGSWPRILTGPRTSGHSSRCLRANSPGCQQCAIRTETLRHLTTLNTILISSLGIQSSTSRTSSLHPRRWGSLTAPIPRRCSWSLTALAVPVRAPYCIAQSGKSSSWPQQLTSRGRPCVCALRQAQQPVASSAVRFTASFASTRPTSLKSSKGSQKRRGRSSSRACSSYLSTSDR
mmetsp:Transcript_8710/g.19349  ORF Transcript_8710/g.19349 Transcript_8710/m.19349 type:complete len:237 (-) Transcript_8710:1971-2681(-)